MVEAVKEIPGIWEHKAGSLDSKAHLHRAQNNMPNVIH